MSNTFACTRRGFVTGLAGVAVAGPLRAAEGLPKVVVTKDPTCGCCSGWVEHLKQAGFPVEVVETSGINRVKTRLGVPSNLASCHTGEVAGYVIEGHVPATSIRRLLAEKPRAIGLAVPGMPVGSPGMEVEGMAPETYEVILFGPGGQHTFARFRGTQELTRFSCAAGARLAVSAMPRVWSVRGCGASSANGPGLARRNAGTRTCGIRSDPMFALRPAGSAMFSTFGQRCMPSGLL
jgi:hypothetical protein